MRISDWSSDVCSSDLYWTFCCGFHLLRPPAGDLKPRAVAGRRKTAESRRPAGLWVWRGQGYAPAACRSRFHKHGGTARWQERSEEHTSELQSLMRISYAVFYLKKKMQQSNFTSIDTTPEGTTETTSQLVNQTRLENKKI